MLARKWRPGNFDQLVGQRQTSQALINALESQRLHHAYLFTGTRGVGKTTIARILSKSLNCEQGITSKPCGECSSCCEISQGNFVDLLEIDAASKTKVEDTRELLDNVQYRPTRGRYKIYLIDEVHMLSGHSFNALLKTLEEPPPHVIFLLATTDPQKMPVTVLSRCLQFHLRRMEHDEITNHLTKILASEEIGYDSEALDAIAKGADGSMRDALSLLDQAIAYCSGDIEKSIVLDMLGCIDRSYSFELLDAICQQNAVLLMETIAKIAEFSPDYDELIADWLSLLHKIAVAQATGYNTDEQISSLAESINAADLQLYYQLSLQARKDLAYAPHPRQGFEMAMLRIIAFQPKKSMPPLATKKKLKNIKPNEQAGVNSPKHTTRALPVEADSTALKSSAPIQSQNRSNQPVEMIKTAPRLQVVAESEVGRQQASQAKSNADKIKTEVQMASLTVVQTDQPVADDPVPIITKPIELSSVNENNWYQVVEAIAMEGNGMQVLLNSIGIYKNQELVINYHSKVETLLTDNARNSVVESLKNYFDGQHLKLSFCPVQATSETPKQRRARLHELAIDNAETKLLANRQVNYLIEHLGATLPRATIKIIK